MWDSEEIAELIVSHAPGDAVLSHWAVQATPAQTVMFPVIRARNLPRRGEGPTLRHLKTKLLEIYSDSVDTLGKLVEEVRAVNRDQRLSPVGRAERQRALREDAIRWLDTGIDQTKTELTRIVTELAELPPAPARDAEDAAGASLDAELRAWFRNEGRKDFALLHQMSQGEQQELLAAIARAPAILSGLKPDQHAELVRVSRRINNPGQYASLSAQHEAASLALLATRRAVEAIAQNTGMAPNQISRYTNKYRAPEPPFELDYEAHIRLNPHTRQAPDEGQEGDKAEQYEWFKILEQQAA